MNMTVQGASEAATLTPGGDNIIKPVMTDFVPFQSDLAYALQVSIPFDVGRNICATGINLHCAKVGTSTCCLPFFPSNKL